MSDFSEKLRRGLVPTAAEWEAHLIEAHADDPRMTPEAFAGYKSEEGLDSYEHLAALLPKPRQDLNVVDLACGDGHLMPHLLSRLGPGGKVTGLDMSPDGLEIASLRIKDPRASFALARAQEMPFQDLGVDAILCHMAFMLMMPVEPVVAEIRRVLKPGGLFAAVMGGRGESEGLGAKIDRLSRLFVQTHLPRYTDARAGSANTGSIEGWSQLFKEGFSSPEMKEFRLRYHVPPEGVWDYIHSMYFIPMLPEAARRELKDELIHLAKDHREDNGQVRFQFPMKMLWIRKH